MLVLVFHWKLTTQSTVVFTGKMNTSNKWRVEQPVAEKFTGFEQLRVLESPLEWLTCFCYWALEVAMFLRTSFAESRFFLPGTPNLT